MWISVFKMLFGARRVARSELLTRGPSVFLSGGLMVYSIKLGVLNQPRLNLQVKKSSVYAVTSVTKLMHVALCFSSRQFDQPL